MESIVSWIQTGILAVTAVFAGYQLKALRSQEQSDDLKRKQRATIDAVMADRRDEQLIASRYAFADMKNSNENFESLAAHQIPNNFQKNKAILDILNNYEFMAAGIREGAFDEEIYKRMKCSLIVQDWEILSVYVFSLRKQTKRERLFIEFQWLAERWKKDSSLKK